MATIKTKESKTKYNVASVTTITYILMYGRRFLSFHDVYEPWLSDLFKHGMATILQLVAPSAFGTV